MKTNEERIHSLLSYLDSLSYIKPEELPDIQLYMDQVTTFMDDHLKNTKRYPEDKVLTKTMINNYAKNNLLPPPVKKKYSKEHLLMLIFIILKIFCPLMTSSSSLNRFWNAILLRTPDCLWKISIEKYFLWKTARWHV